MGPVNRKVPNFAYVNFELGLSLSREVLRNLSKTRESSVLGIKTVFIEKNFISNVKVTNYLTIFHNIVFFGWKIIYNLAQIGLLLVLEQTGVLQQQIVLNKRQFWSRFDCQTEIKY